MFLHWQVALGGFFKIMAAFVSRCRCGDCAFSSCQLEQFQVLKFNLNYDPQSLSMFQLELALSPGSRTFRRRWEDPSAHLKLQRRPTGPGKDVATQPPCEACRRGARRAIHAPGQGVPPPPGCLRRRRQRCMACCRRRTVCPLIFKQLASLSLLA